MTALRPRLLRRTHCILLTMLGFGGAGPSCASSPASSTPPAPARSATASTDPTTGAQLVRAMHDRYPAWYRTLRFVQTTTIYRPGGGTLVQTWPEVGQFPGKLRIETDTVGQGGVIYRADSVYQFAGGRLARADTGMNDLLILGFDVYAQPVEATVAILRRRGFDLGRFSRATFEGRPMWVVGALPGDTTSKQFWVDQERLVFVRLLENRRTPTGMRLDDIRFQKFVRHGGGWVAEEVMFYRDGKPSLHEAYANVQVNVPLDDALFNPHAWTSVAGKWYK